MMTELHVEGTVATDSRGLSEPAGLIFEAELTGLDNAELNRLREVVAAETRSGEGDFVIRCARADKLIVAELYRRVYIQAAIDAKAAVIIDEERRLASG